jgi:hypothetical protein
MPKIAMTTSDLGLTIRELLRYGYGGALALLMAVIIIPDETESMVDALGATLSALVALAVGASIYALYRPIIGQVFFYGLAENIHRKLSRRRKAGYACRSHFLEDRFKVNPSDSLNAYRLIRNSELHDREIRNSFHIQHSEISILQVTFVVLLSFGLPGFVRYLTLGSEHFMLPLLLNLFGLLAGTLAVCGDIQICSYECAYLMTLDEQAVGSRLAKAGLGSAPVGAGAGGGNRCGLTSG